MRKQGPYRLKVLSIVVLTVLSWAFIALAIWIVGKLLVIVLPRQWFPV
jgi:hypothetical protein